MDDFGRCALAKGYFNLPSSSDKEDIKIAGRDSRDVVAVRYILLYTAYLT